MKNTARKTDERKPPVRNFARVLGEACSRSGERGSSCWAAALVRENLREFVIRAGTAALACGARRGAHAGGRTKYAHLRDRQARPSGGSARGSW